MCVCVAAGNAMAQCSTGGNGVVVASNIAIDGNMSDWTTTLNDPDNITYDKSPDSDAPISDVGRDFTRFAFTENITHLFLYFQRAGSVNNSVDLLFYLDVNNNGLMETNEPVIAISWSGSNGNAQVDVYNYIKVAPAGDPVTGDGSKMPGSLTLRERLGNLGKGSADGVSLEVSIAFSLLYKKGSTSNTDSLATTEQFKFHISSINGSVGSVPGSNSINDNFGGCFSGFVAALAFTEKNTNIISGRNRSSENSLAVINPFDGDLVMRYSSIAATTVTFKTYNLSGALILCKKQSLRKGVNEVRIPGSLLAYNGLYLVEATDEYDQRIIQKALKVR